MNPRIIQSQELSSRICGLFCEMAVRLPGDVRDALERALAFEKDPLARRNLEILVENADYAEKSAVPICQDTGMAVVFLDIGQNVLIRGALPQDAVNEGVARAYSLAHLRKSIVKDPLFSRENTGDNTPAVVHISIVPGDKIEILAMMKGFGSENMGAVRLFDPGVGAGELADFVSAHVAAAGGMPCPPLIIGLGIGGTMEKAALLAKRALARRIGSANEIPEYALLEEQILRAVNALGTGPQGMGGDTTALAVFIEEYPTHIAGLPVAVNLGCHASRHARAVI